MRTTDTGLVYGDDGKLATRDSVGCGPNCTCDCSTCRPGARSQARDAYQDGIHKVARAIAAGGSSSSARDAYMDRTVKAFDSAA